MSTAPFVVTRRVRPAEPGAADALIEALDARPGVFYGCDYESQPVFRREAWACVDPALALRYEHGAARLRALDARGAALLHAIAAREPGAWDCGDYVPDLAAGARLAATASAASAALAGPVASTAPVAPTSAVTPSVTPPHAFIALLRRLSALFTGECEGLGFHGAWNSEHGRLRSATPEGPDSPVRVVLYLPLRLLRVTGDTAAWWEYDIAGLVPDASFTSGALAVASPVTSPAASPAASRPPSSDAVPATPLAIKPEPRTDDFRPGEYAPRLAEAIARIRAGEVVSLTLAQGWRRSYTGTAAAVFGAMRQRYPMPQMYFVNMGPGERLLGASPDIQFRLREGELECAPVCGTLRRGTDAMEDRDLGLELLTSTKEAAALALCTDAFAERFAPFCQPGTLRLLSRQRIHFFGSVIHAVDHLAATLAPGADAWDALLASAAPPTITGVPPEAALRVIGDVEGSPREWFGGAVGYVGVGGDASLGTIMRLAWLHDGLAELRTGGVIVAHSKPEAEEEESRVKANTMLRLLGVAPAGAVPQPETPVPAVRLLRTADPFLQAVHGALRACATEAAWVGDVDGLDGDSSAPLVVATLRAGDLPASGLTQILARGRPVVLIGGAALQALAQDGVPVQRLPATMDGFVVAGEAAPGQALAPLGRFQAGVYRDAAVTVDALNAAPVAPLTAPHIALAIADDGTLLAWRHRERPVIGLLFRPESVLSTGAAIGHRALRLALADVAARGGPRP